MITDAFAGRLGRAKGLIAAIRTSFLSASWQRCKMHFMPNTLAHIPHRDKVEFAGQLNSAEGAKERAAALNEKYAVKKVQGYFRLTVDGM